MSMYVNPVDPPDLGLLPTFRRLMPLWWEERRLGFFGLACSLVYVVISVAIPMIIITDWIPWVIPQPMKYRIG